MEDNSEEEPDENEPPENEAPESEPPENEPPEIEPPEEEPPGNESPPEGDMTSLNKNVSVSQKAPSESELEDKKFMSEIIKNKSEDKGKVAREGTVYSQLATQPKTPDAGASRAPTFANFQCSTLLQKRNPFMHDPPQPEERRPRIQNPTTPREYIINLREDLADFQETHGLPRTRDYSFLSLGLALAQETARALCSLFFMFVELFPILAIVSLILRFALDKLIEILETTDPAHKVKKAIIFSLQMLLILIPLWIFVGTIIIPLVALVFSIFKRIFHMKGGKASKDVRECRKKEKVPKNGSLCKQK